MSDEPAPRADLIDKLEHAQFMLLNPAILNPHPEEDPDDAACPQCRATKNCRKECPIRLVTEALDMLAPTT